MHRRVEPEEDNADNTHTKRVTKGSWYSKRRVTIRHVNVEAKDLARRLQRLLNLCKTHQRCFKFTKRNRGLKMVLKICQFC